MTIQNTDIEVLKNNQDYQQFLRDNPGSGVLKVRATSASEALPISDVKITVSKEIGNDIIVFFEGFTDESGMVNNIVLPTPVRVSSDEDVPNFTTYQLRAVHGGLIFDRTYNISICCGVRVIQYINIIPSVQTEVRENGY